MNQVENNKNSVTSEPSYPAGYANPWQDDEIDLVDLWIVMWSYRKLFLSSAILVVVVGILCFELFFNPKPASTVRSIIEIESTISNGIRIPVVDPDALIKRIEYTRLPRFSSLGEFEEVKPLIMATRASRISKGSKIVEIVSKVPVGDIVYLSRFHDQLVDEILLELKQAAVLLTADVRETLFLTQSRIANLKGSVIALEQDLLNGNNSQVTSSQSLQDEFALKKANIQSKIEILTERIKYLKLTLSNTGSLALLKAGVSNNSPRLTKPATYTLILVLSLILALFLTIGVIFAKKVKARMASTE